MEIQPQVNVRFDVFQSNTLLNLFFNINFLSNSHFFLFDFSFSLSTAHTYMQMESIHQMSASMSLLSSYVYLIKKKRKKIRYKILEKYLVT